MESQLDERGRLALTESASSAPRAPPYLDPSQPRTDQRRGGYPSPRLSTAWTAVTGTAAHPHSTPTLPGPPSIRPCLSMDACRPPWSGHPGTRWPGSSEWLLWTPISARAASARLGRPRSLRASAGPSCDVLAAAHHGLRPAASESAISVSGAQTRGHPTRAHGRRGDHHRRSGRDR